MSFDNSFRARLEKKVIKLLQETTADFIESNEDNIHEVGRLRGFVKALKEVLTMCVEVEQEINNEHSPSRTDKTY